MRKITRFLRVQVLVVFLAIFALLPATAHAWLLCRSDPIVILSNGVTLDLGADISTMPWQVQEVHYELHVPRGVSLVLAIHTPAWLTSQETFNLVADQAPAQYGVITTVKTSEGDAHVTAEATLVSALNVKLGMYSVSGREQVPLPVWFKNAH